MYFVLLPQDEDKNIDTKKRKPNARPRTLDINVEPEVSDSLFSTRPLILSRTCKKLRQTNIVASPAEMTIQPLPMSKTGISCHSKPPELQTVACEIPGDGGIHTASYLASTPAIKPCAKQHADSALTVLCCEKVGHFSSGETNMDAAALQAALSQAFSFVPGEMIRDEPTVCFFEERGPDKGENISICEHSYCRPDTDKNELWSKITNLHAKILELDRREESTVAKIHALESEISLLKRDSAAFKEKQKVLEDYISSRLF